MHFRRCDLARGTWGRGRVIVCTRACRARPSDVGGMFVVAEAEARVQPRSRRRSWRPSVDFAIFLREVRQGSGIAVGGPRRDAGLPF